MAQSWGRGGGEDGAIQILKPWGSAKDISEFEILNFVDFASIFQIVIFLQGFFWV